MGLHYGFHLRGNGFTLVELMIVITVLAIGLVLAMPTYEQVRQKRAVTNAAEQTAAFLGLAQSEAIKRNRLITVTIDATGAQWCAGMDDDGTGACNCSDPLSANYCTIDGADSTLILSGSDFENAGQPVLSNGNSNILFTFDPIRGVLSAANATSGEISFTSNSGDFGLNIGINVTGQIELCAPSDKKVPGYKLC